MLANRIGTLAGRLFAYPAVALLLLAANVARGAVSDGEIRVGVLVDMKSVYSHITGTGSVEAARMAIEDAGGAIDGKPIRLFFEDHGNSVERAAAVAREWLFEGGIDVIADVAGSPQALAVQEVNRKKGAVVFYNGVMTTDITGAKCAPTGIHWMYDGHAYNTVIGRELTLAGNRRWYFITVNNAFGLNVEQSLAEIVRASGGEIIGSVRHPLGSTDLFSELREASQAGAQVIALVNAGQDLIRGVRESADLLAVSKGKTLVAAVATALNDVHTIRPQLAQGLRLSHSFYWNMDVESRAWSKRFFERTGAMPSDLQAGVYSSLTHYFKAVKASASDDGMTVVKKMRELPIRDPIVRNARLREDGRMVHDIYLLRVKSPGDVKEPWDYLEIMRSVPGDRAFRPMDKGGCPLVSKGAADK
jgi:branched-chain amino acid transport system substrate-binding protein